MVEQYGARMADLSYDELRRQLKAECRARRWRVPSRGRLTDLRAAGRLPPAIRCKGEWRYEESTVAAYVHAEELRRASGKRVRSWKLVASRERTAALREWFVQPDLPVPRDLIGDGLEELPRLFRRVAPALYPYVEKPIGAFEDSRLKGAHDAIDAMLDAAGLTGDARAAAEALLQMLIFRDEDGNAENIDLGELLEPINRKMGAFAFSRLGDGIAGLCRVIRETPINELLTHPCALLDSVSDDEFRVSARAIRELSAAIQRFAEGATLVRPIAKRAAAIQKFLRSDEASWLLCAIALVTIWPVRRNPNARMEVGSLAATVAGFASRLEQSTKPPSQPQTTSLESASTQRHIRSKGGSK